MKAKKLFSMVLAGEQRSAFWRDAVPIRAARRMGRKRLRRVKHRIRRAMRMERRMRPLMRKQMTGQTRLLLPEMCWLSIIPRQEIQKRQRT